MPKDELCLGQDSIIVSKAWKISIWYSLVLVLIGIEAQIKRNTIAFCSLLGMVPLSLNQKSHPIPPK